MPATCTRIDIGVPVAAVGILSAEHLAEHLAPIARPSTVIIGVGNDMCGDDGAGPMVARRLAGRVPWTIFDTQTVPESFLMKIVNLEPASVILVDALDFGAPPGCVELFDTHQLCGQGPSTHGPAPLAFLDLLQMMHRCRRTVLGVQPQRVEFGSAMQPAVRRAVDLIARGFVMTAGHRRTPEP
jgi:hydrogenase 3 maturation protease